MLCGLGVTEGEARLDVDEYTPDGDGDGKAVKWRASLHLTCGNTLLRVAGQTATLTKVLAAKDDPAVGAKLREIADEKRGRP